MNPEWGRAILALGIVFCLVGGLLLADVKWLSWLGNLPGDIRVERKNFSFYFPLTTMILLSAVISLLWRLWKYLG